MTQVSSTARSASWDQIDELWAIPVTRGSRDWGQFHKPKNLALALAGEVGELLAEMQWLTDDQVHERLADLKTRNGVEEEFADVFLYLVQLADACGVDLVQVARAKITRNDQRFPSAQPVV